jgi:hypothetical protein
MVDDHRKLIGLPPEAIICNSLVYFPSLRLGYNLDKLIVNISNKTSICCFAFGIGMLCGGKDA